MALVVPTITAENPHQYRKQIERVQGFATHLHLDLMDGRFTPNTSLDLEHLWLPDDITCDIHVMYENPELALEEVKKFSVRTFIVPAESSCDFKKLAELLEKEKIQFGVALLAATTVESAKSLIEIADHVLIFSGNLGHQGGSVADLNLLKKIEQIKSINPQVEIGWDGGVNESNIRQIADAGVDIINVGGAVHFASNPRAAFEELHKQLS
jgi:ribulose-phosphate 3-epimerase